MRIALLADIHGNPLALDAVLEDIRARGGVDSCWILGDLCAIGYDPAGVAEQLRALPDAVFIRGNADRFTSCEDRPFPSIEQASKNPALIPLVVEVGGSFAWTQGHLEARDHLDWLRSLPLEHRLTLPDGTRALLIHAAPGTDDGEGLNPSLTDGELEIALTGCDADLICVGHFHMPMERRLNGWHAVNPGSVSNAFAPDLRAAYAILSADARGYEFSFFRVDYDREAAIAATQRTRYPGAGFVVRFLEGRISPLWMKHWDGRAYLPAVSGGVEMRQPR